MQEWSMRDLRQHSIYAYIDPRNEEIFYVGKDSNRGKRGRYFAGHTGHCRHVIRKLKRFGMVPRIAIVQEFEAHGNIYDILNLAEIFWIAEFRRRGCPLTNISNGGGGVSGLFGEKNAFFGKRHSLETIRKIRAAKLGKHHEELHKQRIRGSIHDMIKNGTHPLTKRVKCIDDGKEFCSMVEASRHYQIHYSNLSECVRGIRKTAGGKRFKLCEI